MASTIEQQDRQFRRFLWRMLLVICLLYAFLMYAIFWAEWSPGKQDEIYREYKAQKHEAISAPVDGKEEKP